MRNASPFANPILTPLKMCLRAGTTPYKRLENTKIKPDFSGLFNTETTVLNLLNAFYSKGLRRSTLFRAYYIRI